MSKSDESLTAASVNQFDAARTDSRVRHAMRIIENEQSNVPSLRKIADMVGMSPFYFSRVFAQQVGKSIAVYGRQIRLDHAASRMRYAPGPISPVAADFGYVSQAAFTRAFSARFGMPPARFQALAHGIAGPDAIAPAAWQSLVTLADRPPTRLAARRFFGEIGPDCWRTMEAALPPALSDQQRVCLIYDDPAITPLSDRRHDLCVALDSEKQVDAAAVAGGFDALEIPAGLQASLSRSGTMREIAQGIRILSGGWLPTQRRLGPEGDPFLLRYRSTPTAPRADADVLIRVFRFPDQPKYNLSVGGQDFSR